MQRCVLFWSLCLAGVVAGLVADGHADEERDTTAKRSPQVSELAVGFLAEVQPILKQNCYECHSGETEEGELNLAIKSRAIEGGENGAAVVPGDSKNSALVHLISGIDPDRMMPPEDKEPLSAEQIGVLRAWIDQGAKWPDGADVLDPRLERAKDHWAFKRLRSVDVPSNGHDGSWSQTEIDAFISAEYATHQLSPSAPATAAKLARRIYFALIGLPPTPSEAKQFSAAHLADPQTSVSQLVDRLLGSQHYGERWARHWLDVARYADSDGQELDADRPHAFHYRDFVIEAFNDDMPYDQFVRWQIAGDEYEPDNDAAVSATGFLTAGPSFKLQDTFLERERLLNRYNELDDVISTLGSGLLGISVACARCHDHKYDAFSAREYYQLLGVFHSGDRVSAKLPSGQDGFFFRDFDDTVRTTWLFRRSDFYDREIEVGLGFPAVVSAKEAEQYLALAKNAVENPKSTLQRRALAEWLTDVDMGGGSLLARVIVNRVWQHHFGHGLVRTPSDFGVRGDQPSHPELLEFLASDFVANGWKIKRLHRMILNSAVWQQGNERSSSDSVADTEASKVDPANRFLWKMTPQRLEAEALRDAMLSVSGTLSLEAGGPGFKPYIPPEANLARNIKDGGYPKEAPDDSSTRRRSVYMFHKRLIPYPLFQAFDRPDLMTACARRQNTTVAPQAMALLNDRFVRTISNDFAKRLLESEEEVDDQQLVESAFEYLFSRMPTATEIESSVAFLRSQQKVRTSRGEENPRLQAATDYCQSLMGLNEFIYVD